MEGRIVTMPKLMEGVMALPALLGSHLVQLQNYFEIQFKMFKEWDLPTSRMGFAYLQGMGFAYLQGMGFAYLHRVGFAYFQGMGFAYLQGMEFAYLRSS